MLFPIGQACLKRNILFPFLFFISLMAFVIFLSNIFVQFPVRIVLFGVDLSEFLTWGAFTYPFSYLITDLVNQRYGIYLARLIVMSGFLCTIFLSFLIPFCFSIVGLADTSVVFARVFRIAIASGLAFFCSHFLDIYVFNYFRFGLWWRAPIFGSILGSACDSILFFCIAFSSYFSFLGISDSFALEISPISFLDQMEVTRWISWGICDFLVKLLLAIFALIPYRLVIFRWRRNVIE